MLPYELLTYANEHPEFPIDSTADQWFDHGQFNAYHLLGHEMGKAVVAAATRLEAQVAAEAVDGAYADHARNPERSDNRKSGSALLMARAEHRPGLAGHQRLAALRADHGRRGPVPAWLVHYVDRRRR